MPGYGLEGLAVLGAASLGFGVFAALVVGTNLRRRLLATAITTVASFGVGLLTGEWLSVGQPMRGCTGRG